MASSTTSAASTNGFGPAGAGRPMELLLSHPIIFGLAHASLLLLPAGTGPGNLAEKSPLVGPNGVATPTPGALVHRLLSPVDPGEKIAS